MGLPSGLSVECPGLDDRGRAARAARSSRSSFRRCWSGVVMWGCCRILLFWSAISPLPRRRWFLGGLVRCVRSFFGLRIGVRRCPLAGRLCMSLRSVRGPVPALRPGQGPCSRSAGSARRADRGSATSTMALARRRLSPVVCSSTGCCGRGWALPVSGSGTSRPGCSAISTAAMSSFLVIVRTSLLRWRSMFALGWAASSKVRPEHLSRGVVPDRRYRRRVGRRRRRVVGAGRRSGRAWRLE